MYIDADAKETRPISIMHVEDRPKVAGAVKKTLEDEGWRVETCTEGTAAMRLLESEAHYDVLIFDNQLPDINGVELIQRTRRLPHRQQTPIIMLSASDIEREARQAGADVVLKKPNDILKIAEAIARLLARKPKIH
jgi:two-component system sensor histidine kinase BarA